MKPIRSMRVYVAQKASVEMALWEGIEREGKALPSSVSIKWDKDGESQTAFLKAADALKVAAVLQGYALEAMEIDLPKRIEHWKKQKETEKDTLVTQAT